MGNRTSRKSTQTEEHCSSNQTFDQQHFNKLHNDAHYNVINKILHHHLTLMDSNIDTQNIATNIHKSGLNIAIEHHINAAYFEKPAYQYVQQTIYMF